MIGITGRSNRSSVSQKRLGDLAVFENGDPYRPVDWSESGLPIVRIENLNNPCAPYHYYQGPTADKVQIGNGELLLAWSASLGVYQWNRGLALLNQHIFRVTPLSNDVTSDYLYHILSWALSGLAALTHGGTMHHIQKPALESYLVPCPPLAEQRRIAAKLDEQMASLASAQAALAAQREATTVLRSAVLRTALDPATHPAWPAVQLSQICTIVMGQSPPGDTYATSPVGLPFFQGKVDFGAFSPAARVWCVSPIKIAEKGDILLCVRAPVGPTNVANERCCIGRGLAALRPSTKLLPAFLLWWLKYVEPQISSLGEGSTFSAIGKSELQNLRIQLPALSEQRRIAEHLDSSIKEVDAVVASLDSQASTLDVLRTSLLDAAFSGQV